MLLGAGVFLQHWDVRRARRIKDMLSVDGSGLSAVKALREAVLEGTGARANAVEVCVGGFNAKRRVSSVVPTWQCSLYSCCLMNINWITWRAHPYAL